MSTIRIAVASTPLTATLDEAVPAAVAAVEEAGRLGARIVCLPETGLPGHRDQARPVPDVSADALDDALHEVAEAARRAGVVTIVGTERPTPAGREIVSVVLGADGIDGSASRRRRRSTRPRSAHYVAGHRPPRVHRRGRDLRDRDLPRGIPLPGDRPLARPRRRADHLRPALRDDRRRLAAGALVRRVEPVQREGAPVPGAREHGLRRARPTWPDPTRARSTGIIAPDGTLVASLDYGAVGVVAADIDLDRADRRLALRWAPERNTVAVDQTGGGP